MTKAFPIPVRAIGPGSQVEDEDLVYMPMPQGMNTFQPPVLPEPEEVTARTAAKAALGAVRQALAATLADGVNRSVPLDHLREEDRQLVNTVLGEGEVSALASWGDEPHRAGGDIRIQESVFAGVWRVIRSEGGAAATDAVEVGAIPAVLESLAAQDARDAMPQWSGPLPPEVQNAPLLLTEIEQQYRRWQPGQPTHVINLTLLPMSAEDIAFMDHHLGTGRVLLLSRGYGNCRITNARVPHTWRVVYYNSQDAVILNAVEIGALPEVARAAPQDLEDSLERLDEALDWIGDGA